MVHSYTERPRYFCSFGGALSTLEALPDTIAIMHAPAGCAASVAWGQNGGSAMEVGGYCGGLSVPSSNVCDKDVIFGGADRLTEQIHKTFEIMEGRLFVVITSCVTEIIGDDVKAIVSEIRSEIDNDQNPEKPALIFANTGGFLGNSYKGYDIVMSAIVRQFVTKSKTKKRGKVNILGIVPFMDCFWQGNLEGIRKALELLGLEVNTYFTGQDSLDAIRNSSEAELNIVVSDVYGIDIAKEYKKVHEIPYIVSSLPIGPTATEKFLRDTAQALKLEINLEEIIDKQYRDYYHLVNPLVDAFYDGDHQRYAIIIADVNYAVAITRFLFDDLGWIPAHVQFTENLTKEQQKTISDKLSVENPVLNPQVIFDANPSEAGRYINARYPKRDTDLYVESLTPVFVFGSSLERDLAIKLAAPHLSISFPITNRAVINRGYTGFSGGLTLIEDVLSAVLINR